MNTLPVMAMPPEQVEWHGHFIDVPKRLAVSAQPARGAGARRPAGGCLGPGLALGAGRGAGRTNRGDGRPGRAGRRSDISRARGPRLAARDPRRAGLHGPSRRPRQLLVSHRVSTSSTRAPSSPSPRGTGMRRRGRTTGCCCSRLPCSSPRLSWSSCRRWSRWSSRSRITTRCRRRVSPALRTFGPSGTTRCSGWRSELTFMGSCRCRFASALRSASRCS